MGFMDKAKQLAEQAQQKLEETQKRFNEGQAAKAGGETANVRYDEHGRPIQTVDDSPQTADRSGDAPAESAQPAADAPAAEEPAAEQPAPAKPSSEGVDSTPDPFKPIQ